MSKLFATDQEVCFRSAFGRRLEKQFEK